MIGSRRSNPISILLQSPSPEESVSQVSSVFRQRAIWLLSLLLLAASIAAIPALNARSARVPGLGAGASGSDELHDGAARLRPLRFQSGGVCRRRRRGRQARCAHLRFEALAHHAAGRVHRRGSGGCGFRSRRLAGLLRHQQPRGQPQSSVPEQGRRHLRGRGCGARRGRRESTKHRRVDGRRLGRLRQRRLRRPPALPVRASGALSQRAGATVRGRGCAGGTAGARQRECSDVARLRPRRPSRSVHCRLLGRVDRSVVAHHHAHHAGELRVRQQRRPQVSAVEPWRRDVRGSHHRRRHHAVAAGRWR